jgi:hypothetical protein
MRMPWLLLAIVVLYGELAVAQPAVIPELPSVTSNQPIELDVSPALSEGKPISTALSLQGYSGIWFPMVSAKAILTKIQQIEFYEQLQNSQEALIAVHKHRITLLEDTVLSATKVSNIWKEAAETQSALKQTKTSFWESPTLWGVVGFVLGTATTVAITYVVTRQD